MLAWVGPAQRTLLATVALEHGGVQIQAVSRGAFRQPMQLPTPQAGEETPLRETLEQVANRVVDRETGDPQ
jgi:hypothetical protein